MAGAPPPLILRRAGISLVAALCVAGASSPAHAAAPRREWRTIVTPSFRVHYHEGLGPLAEHLAGISEVALDEVSALLGNHPETPIHVVLTDETDGANGFAEVLPENMINLYCAVPEPFGALGDHDDFMRLLFIHELTHIVHLDTIGGIAHALNTILGKTFAPNHVQPRWLIEGIAVYVESKLTSGGRIYSSLVDMLIREQVLAGRFWSLGEISTQTRRFPGGSIAWNVGGRFVDFVARRHGEGAIAQISRDYGARFVPYAVNVVAREVTGEDYPALWEAFRREEEAKALVVLEGLAARGVVDGHAIPRPAAEVYHPAFSPAGELAIVEAPRDGEPAVVFLAADLETELARFDTSNGAGAFASTSGVFVAAITDTTRHVFGYNDLEQLDPRTGSRRRLTHGARLDEPAVSPDGRFIAAVERGAGRTHLVLVPRDGAGPPRRIFTPPSGHQVSAPSFAPDGVTLVVSLLVPDGGRHLALVDRERGTFTELTATRAQDLDPVFSADGSRVFFSSDRGGIFNIHAADVGTGHVERLTDVATGAFQPAVDPRGGRLAFVLGTDRGFELRVLELAKLVAREPGPAPVRPAVEPQVSLVSHPDEPYSPWETLLPAVYVPTAGLDGLGDTVGVLLTGSDAVGAHYYSATLELGLASERLNYAVYYSNRAMWTPLSISSSLIATARPASFPSAIAALDRPESIFRVRAGIDLPFGRWDAGYGFGLSYGVELRTGLATLPDDPIQEAPPPSAADLQLASLALSWRFSSVRYFADSISPASGQALDLTLDLHDPLLGSDLRLLSVTSHWAGFLPLPWLEHHVLAGRVALGASAGDARGRSTYALGGLEARNILRDVVDERRTGTDAIRGYEVAAFRGNAFWLATLEYRLPIIPIELGYETMPLFLDRLYAAMFVDAGDTPRDQLDLEAAKVGAGAELRLDFVLGYYLPITARLGYARGLSQGGIHNPFLVLGGAF